MFRVIKEPAVWIAEDARGLFKSNPVLLPIGAVLPFVLIETQHI
jgi:hypothetical protein